MGPELAVRENGIRKGGIPKKLFVDEEKVSSVADVLSNLGEKKHDVSTLAIKRLEGLRFVGNAKVVLRLVPFKDLRDLSDPSALSGRLRRLGCVHCEEADGPRAIAQNKPFGANVVFASKSSGMFVQHYREENGIIRLCFEYPDSLPFDGSNCLVAVRCMTKSG